MPKRAFDTLSEPMFYILMALERHTLCGADIVSWISRRTDERVQLGPGTLYTILPKLTDEGLIRQVSTDGRKRNYALTDKGRALYWAECSRLRRCVADMDAAEEEQDAPAEYRKEA